MRKNITRTFKIEKYKLTFANVETKEFEEMEAEFLAGTDVSKEFESTQGKKLVAFEKIDEYEVTKGMPISMFIEQASTLN